VLEPQVERFQYSGQQGLPSAGPPRGSYSTPQESKLRRRWSALSDKSRALKPEGRLATEAKITSVKLSWRSQANEAK
jgi:hypothetical protein